ncbi:MAG: (P)ppGpp synthetase I, SpoT/RelA [Parcubacteria group bacterium GW2011_GWA2_47_7]|nr:MAG: (P)ppGpp synthetase I, SpoT/RelA [Parcubacteria group bacterium GW2011_GWA2_47_7]
MERVKTLEEITSIMRSKEPEHISLVQKAYDFAERAHHGQKRYSGDPYFIHVAAVGYTLAEMGMGATTISAGLLHDVVEDANVSAEDIEKEFGEEICILVDGVTKLGKLKYRGVERHVESLRKLFVSTAKDLRVIIIKLADRLHNVSTLKYVPKEKQQRIALETLEIYAPIANRLSIGKIKGKLEDYAFPFAYPEEYEKLQELLKERTRENEKRLEKTYRGIQVELAKNGMINVHGEFRIKRMYSLYKKLLERKMDISKIYDLSAIRVIVPTLSDCYRALGIIHSVWRPLPGRIKDYIAFPKPNGYQSLHTTIFTGDGGIIEVQLRTEEMDRDASLGIAAHFAYKENIPLEGDGKLARKLDWVKQISQLQQSISASGEYLENLKVDFFGDRIFLFTPLGDVVDLPVDSSPIDFAYAIHSDIGDHVSGANINGKFLSLDTKLHNGDIVEIITKKSAHPSNKWLAYTKTTFAKKSVRSFLQKEAESKK